MIAAHQGGTLEQAIDWIERQAAATYRTLEEIALGVLERRIHVSQ